MKILKFGGSSVANAERIRQVISIVDGTFSPGHDTAPPHENQIRGVVVSALQGGTDSLIEAAQRAAAKDEAYREITKALETRHLVAVQELIPAVHRGASLASVKVLLNELGELLQGIFLLGECTTRTLDLIMSFGERLSSLLVNEAFKAAGHDTEALDARSIIITNDSYGNARPIKDLTERAIREYFGAHPKLQIVTGFIGSTQDGGTTTLGRGGSDFTASILGAALGAQEVEIWTDVDGMLTADPRKVPKAFPIAEVTFEEAMELCHFGAKVLYPPTMQPAMDAGISLVIKNTLNPSARGTHVVPTPVRQEFPVTGISSISDVALIRLQGSGMVGVAGVAMRFFRALASRSISVILITQASSEHTICCAIDPRYVGLAQQAVAEEFALEIATGLISPLVTERDLAIVSVVGEKMRKTPGVSARLFGALGSNGVNIVAIAQGSSELNISAVVPKRDESKALNAIHDEFFAVSSKTLNVWLLGTGLVGTTLLRQLREQRPILLQDLGLDLQIRGLANSRQMRLANGHPLLEFEEFSSVDVPFELESFLSHIVESNLSNCVFIDCTASDQVTSVYARLLERSIAVVTPNKRGVSGTMDLYRTLKGAAQRRRTPFLHETAVGAALPVLSTLNDLVRSGDRIHSIEAVLSGTLSYIFNTLTRATPFSAAVREAKDRGYTEPDPRDDLSGLDVARKVLILAREAGLALELSDINREALLPDAALAWSLDEFMNRLPELDGHFENLRCSAEARGERLFFSAKIDCRDGKATMGLRSVPLSHPFCALSGSDNIVSFSTHRYSKHPLVVKGPGAGAEVTAAGVFADIIRIGH